MSLKHRIEVFLKAQGKTLSDLADNIEIDLTELERGINDNSVEVRTLENISKALRIPLYSFFPGYLPKPGKSEIPYYNRRLPEENENTGSKISESNLLKEDIKFLTKYLKFRQKQLDDLKKDKNT